MGNECQRRLSPYGVGQYVVFGPRMNLLHLDLASPGRSLGPCGVSPRGLVGLCMALLRLDLASPENMPTAKARRDLEQSGPRPRL
eukprot:4178410-Pyramimonas_sp.AAC.1